MIDDIELAMVLDPELGRLYESGKNLSGEAPALSLSHLRGFAHRFCTLVDEPNAQSSEPLAQKIRNLGTRGIANRPVLSALGVLHSNGNIAAHPEHHGYASHDFGGMSKLSLDAALRLLKELYWRTHQVEVDCIVAPVKSNALWQMCGKAMLDGDPEAMFQAGSYFMECSSPAGRQPYELSARECVAAEESLEQALFWMRRAAVKEHVGASYSFGHHLVSESTPTDPQHTRGQNFIAHAARADLPDALVYVGNAYLHGNGIFQKDPALAREMYEKAVRSGHPEALAQLGAMLSLGIGGIADKAAAARYTTEAANAGDPQAQYNLSVMYLHGDGVQKDMATGLTYLQEAASQGYPDAIYNLAASIEGGLIPGQSELDAEEQYIRALQFPDYRARSALYAAGMIERRATHLEDWVKAADYLQVCFEMVATEDPHQLRDDCLDACKRIVCRARDLIRQADPGALETWHLHTLCLFDRHCVPVTDRSARFDQIQSQVVRSTERSAVITNTLMMCREACIDPPARTAAPQVAVTRPLRAVETPGRNDACGCGSGNKYKKCHGAANPPSAQ
jgi:TPR repeat protein